MTGPVDTAAQAAAREAARREAARIAQEQARRMAQQQQANQAQQQAATTETKIALTQEQFTGDAKLAEALGASQEKMQALFEQAASLDGDADALSNAELEQLFLNVQTGQAMSKVVPDEATQAEEAEDPTKAQETFEKVLGDSPAIQKYMKAKARYDAALEAAGGDPKGCAQCAAELMAASGEVMQALAERGAKNPALRKQVATALDLVKLDIEGAQAQVKQLTGLGATADLLGKAADGFGKLIELTDAFKTLASGGEGDGLKHGVGCAEAAVEIGSKMAELFGQSVKGPDGKLLETTPGLIEELGGASRTALVELRGRLAKEALGLAEGAGGKEAYQLAAKAWERMAAQAGKFGEKADVVLGKLKEKLVGALERWSADAAKQRAAAASPEAAAALEKLMFDKLSTVLGKVAGYLEAAGTVLTAVQVALEVTDFMLRDLYMPAKEALTGIFSSVRHMDNDPNELLALYQGGATTYGEQPAKLRELAGQEGWKDLYAANTQEAQAFVRQVNDTLLCQSTDRRQTTEMLRDEVGAALKGQQVTVVDEKGKATSADAGTLYARARGKEAPPLTPGEALALAGPLGKAATEALAKDLAMRDQLTPTGLAPENVTPAIATAMAQSKDPLLMAQYLRSLSDEQVGQLPKTVKRQLLEAVGAQMNGVLDQALGGDAHGQVAGRLLASIMKDNAAQTPPITPAQQAADMQAFLAQVGELNTDNVLRFATEALGREGMDALSTEVKQAIVKIVTTSPVSEADTEAAVKFAESIRRAENRKEAGKGDQLADAIEDPLKGTAGWSADVVARTRVGEMSDAELDKLPLAQKQALAAAMLPTLGWVGEAVGALSDGDVQQLTRLAEAIRRNTNPEAGLTQDQANAAADALIAKLSSYSQDDAAMSRIAKLPAAELAKLPEADLTKLMDQLTAPGTRFAAEEKDAFAKVALALVEQAGVAPDGTPKPEPARSEAVRAAYDQVRAKLAAAEGGRNLDSGSLQDDVQGKVVDLLKAKGEALDPQQDLLAGLPDPVRRQIFDDLATGWADAEDLARATAVANTFAEPTKTELLGKLQGGLTNQSDVTAAAVKNMTDEQLAQLAKQDPERAMQLIRELQDNTFYTSGDKDALTARVALALMKDQGPERRAEVYAQTMERTGYSSTDDVSRAIIDGMGPYDLAALPAATREAMVANIQGDAFFFTGSPEDAAALARLRAAGELAKDRPAGPRGPEAAQKLAAELTTWSDKALAAKAAQNPEELEATLQDVARAPASPERDALLKRMATALREHHPHGEAAKAAVDARLKALNL